MAFVDIQFGEETQETKKVTERTENSLEVFKWTARTAMVTGAVAVGVCLLRAITGKND